MSASPRRILMLLGWYYPDSIGGTEAYVRMLARDLHAAGYHIVIAAPAHNNIPSEYIEDGISVYRYPITPTPSLAEVRGEEPPQYLATFRRWLQNQRPDLVHLHSFTRSCGFFHAHQSKMLGLPLCLTVHVPSVTCGTGTMQRWKRVPCDGIMHGARCTACMLHDKGVPRLVGYAAARVPQRLAQATRRWRNRLATGLQMAEVVKNRQTHVHSLLAMVDHIVVVSQWLHDVLRRNGVAPHKLTLSRHGLSPEVIGSFTPRPFLQTSTSLRVGYVGRFHPTKGVHVLVEAVRRLPASTPLLLHLYGVASGAEERQYLATVQRLAEGDSRIAFMGAMTEQNRREVFGSFDVLGVPSLCQETGPLVALEAFAAGIPVVGSESGGLAELIVHGESGLLIPTGSRLAWRRTLCALADQWARGAWTWHLPPVRKSSDVARDMQWVYENTWTEHQRSLVHA